jgi:SET domain-containing protein
VICDLKYINHCERPNACYYDDLSVVALRDIEAGEEITHDYCCGDW